MPAPLDLSNDDFDDVTPALTGRGDRKLQRLLDIIAALLARRFPVSFDDLVPDVPEYLVAFEQCADRTTPAQKTLYESLKRKWERDKEELRALGIVITSRVVPGDSDETSEQHVYSLDRRDFYLPYLTLVTQAAAAASPSPVKRDPYYALRELTFEPDELTAVVQAAASIRALGDTVLRADVESALRKLAVDLPLDEATDLADHPRVVSERVRADRGLFDALSTSLHLKKAVRFEYRSMHADRVAVRDVDPYGLFFSSGHWYLVARDREQDTLRNFRLSRMGKVSQLNDRNAEPDFEVPAGFSLRDHARTRQAWELGDDAPLDVVVAFEGLSGQAVAAMSLGAEVPGEPSHRRFRVRRPDAFARWMLSFAGDVRVIAPPALAAQVTALARHTRTLYEADDAASAAPARVRKPGRTVMTWNAQAASEKLKRILHVLPQLADGEEHSLADVAARVGSDVKTVLDDLHSLAARVDEPAGFVEKVRISITANTVSAESRHLRRPMRLTMSELCALHLGLSVLRTVRPPDERPVLERARKRLELVFGQFSDPLPDALYAVSLGDEGSVALASEVRDASRQRRKIRIGYRKSGNTALKHRAVCPYTLLVARGMMYLVAYCEDRADMRIFRMDRVSEVTLLDETFTAKEYDLEQIARDGRVFMGGDHDTMLVRYSPQIARWIAEREQREPAADGSLVLDHPLADVEWAVRHVLQYGPDAEVLSPASLRARMRVTLDDMLA